MAFTNLEYALDLMRRLPPVQLEENLDRLCDLVPDMLEDLLSSVDQPLKVAHDKKCGKDYLLCDYNRDGDSYRSPWSNNYDPPFNGIKPNKKLRDIEIEANDAFDIYRQLYYEGGISSVYLWESDNGFAGVVLIKKTQDHVKSGQPMSGAWDSIHVFEFERNKYILTSTVLLSIETEDPENGNFNLSGNITRQEEFIVDSSEDAVENIGKMVEAMENKLRQSIEIIYFDKTKHIINQLRSIVSLNIVKARDLAYKNVSSNIPSS